MVCPPLRCPDMISCSSSSKTDEIYKLWLLYSVCKTTRKICQGQYLVFVSEESPIVLLLYFVLDLYYICLLTHLTHLRHLLKQSCRLVTIETLITILTIENLNSWQSLLPDNQEWHWTAFASLVTFMYRFLSNTNNNYRVQTKYT